MKKIIVMFFLLGGCILPAHSDCNLEDKLVGIWSDQFPIAGGIRGGYIFLREKVYIYYARHTEDIENQYNGSLGRWKIESNGKIFIKKEKEFYWKNKWIQSTRGLIPGEKNYIYCIRINEDWKFVGSLTTFINLDIERGIPTNILLKEPANEIEKRYALIEKEPKAEKHWRKIIDDRMKMDCGTRNVGSDQSN